MNRCDPGRKIAPSAQKKEAVLRAASVIFRFFSRLKFIHDQIAGRQLPDPFGKGSEMSR
jgi:hypothetical protein